MAKVLLLRSLCIGLLLLIVPRSLSADDSIEEQIAVLLQHGQTRAIQLESHGLTAQEVDQALIDLYLERDNEPLWIEDDSPNDRAQRVRALIQNIGRDGLDPEEYFLSEIDQRWNSSSNNSLAELELIISLGVIHLVADASNGRYQPRQADIKLFFGELPQQTDFLKASKEVLVAEDIEKAIWELFPNHRQYLRMRAALAEYKALLHEGTWQKLTVPKGTTLKLGSQGASVQALAERLAKGGDLSPSHTVEDTVNTELIEALHKFQKRHGLPPSNDLNTATLQELNVPLIERIETIIINLERWRWLQRDFKEGKEIFVNVAGYELFGINDGVPTLRLPVIVGKTYHATPIFSSFIRYVEFNPTWNVPVSIAVNEMLPKLKKDKNYLVKEHLQLYAEGGDHLQELSSTAIDWNSVSAAQMRRYSIKQVPGPWNALGTMKFIFPNPYSVYLHDTPQRQLFNQQVRAFSHGCIRVGNAEQLALFLLDTPSERWTNEKIQQIVSANESHIAMLPEPVRVHINYRTAWVEPDGSIQFRRDLYKRDALMKQMMF